MKGRALLAALALAGCAPGPGAARLADSRPVALLAPARPCAGDAVTVTGQGATPGEPLEAWIGPESCCGKMPLMHPRDTARTIRVATATADAAGRFAFTFRMVPLGRTGAIDGSGQLWLVYTRSDTVVPGAAALIGCGAPDALPEGITVDPRIAGLYGAPADVAWQVRPDGRPPAIYAFGKVRAGFAPGTTPEAAAQQVSWSGVTLGPRVTIPSGVDGAAIATDMYELEPRPTAGDISDLATLLATDRGPDLPRPPLVYSSDRALRLYHAWLRLRGGGARGGLTSLPLEPFPVGERCSLLASDPYARPGCSPQGVYTQVPPTVTLTPEAPCAGDAVVVEGRGAPPGEPIGAWVGPIVPGGFKSGLPHPSELPDHTAVGTATAAADGTFRLAFEAPAGGQSLWLTYDRAGTIAPNVTTWYCGGTP